MSGDSSDSDAPEEFTAQQGIQQDEEITKVQRENKARVVREVKERRRQWAQKLTPKQPCDNGSIQDAAEIEIEPESQVNRGMLPDEIVKLLAAQENKVFLDTEEDSDEEKHSSKKKKPKRSGPEPVILKNIPPPQCLQNSLEFLKKRKMQVSRSTAVLDNANQALRLISTSGLLSKK